MKVKKLNMRIRKLIQDPLNELHFHYYNTKIVFLKKFLGWKEGHEEYPEIGQRCLVQGFKGTFQYTKPKDEDLPPFAESEQQKRYWYYFVDEQLCRLNAGYCLWKPKGDK